MRIFIGYDSREDAAYEVARRSILNYADVYIIPIKQDWLRAEGVYWRPVDPLSSTEFSFTRFLVPYLNGYRGWAIFMDCDFLVRGNIMDVMDFVTNQKAVWVVQHEYKPKEMLKMDNRVQHPYPRKNWSSFMVMDCSQLHMLTPEIVNTATGMYLHRFEWLPDELIGSLPVTFNYLEGWHTKNDEPDPICVHFTRGGPWFNAYKDVEYADEWQRVEKTL